MSELRITLSPDQASLLRDCLESRRSGFIEPHPANPLVAQIDALEDLLAEAAAGNAPRPSSRLDRLWAVFAPSAAALGCDVLWPCTVNDLRYNAMGGGRHPEAVFTDEAEARLFAQKLLVERARQLHAMAAALEAHP